jgi:hypothetical protein
MKTPKYQIRIDNAVVQFTGEPIPEDAELHILCESIFDVLETAQSEQLKGDSLT